MNVTGSTSYAVFSKLIFNDNYNNDTAVFMPTRVPVLCTVPGKAPAVTAGAYETMSHDTDGQKRVKLYWQVI